ncbi:MAG: hypothetical protein C0487_00850 [Leptothrix sp. (in: Bacteria)]|nr:hypothetical protein [Leptothrix sp. (in: b-proteobacteria)]
MSSWVTGLGLRGPSSTTASPSGSSPMASLAIWSAQLRRRRLV